MHIVKRIFGALFLLGGLVCLFACWSLFNEGNKNDAFGWGGGGGAALLFSLVLFATSSKPAPPVQGMFPGQPVPGGPYPQQGYPPYPQQGAYPQQGQYPQQGPQPGYPAPPPGPFPPRR